MNYFRMLDQEKCWKQQNTLLSQVNCFKMSIYKFRKFGLIILILEVMIFFQIKVMHGKNSSVIHTQALIMLKYIQNLSEIIISEPTQRDDNYAEQLVTHCNGDDGWWEVEERTSGVTDTLLQEPAVTENVEKIITIAPGEGNKP